MTHNALTTRRLQLLANGYAIIPTNGKLPSLKGWNTDRAVRDMRRVEEWEQRYSKLLSTGVRLDGGLGAVDNDCDNAELAEFFWQAVERHAPQLLTHAPARFGRSEYKVALFVRYEAGDIDKKRLHSHKYASPEELAAWEAAVAANPDTEVERPGHMLEIFTGRKTAEGKSSHQMAVDGPHSFNADGSVRAVYSWGDGPTLLDTPLGRLPVLTQAQALAIIDDFDRAAQAAGFIMEVKPQADEGSEAFDVDDATVFMTQHHGTRSYAELDENMRCASNFIAGDSGRRRDKCSVLPSVKHGCLAIYDHETCVWHLPKAKAKAPVDTEALGEALREVAAEHGITIGREPLWREVTKTGMPRPSLYNARLAIASLGLELSFDTFHGRLWIGRGAAASPSEPLPRHVGEMTDARLLSLRFHLSDLYGVDLTEKFIRDAAMELADEHRFDPVADMLAEAQASWDGVARLDRMAAEHLGCADTELNRACVRKTMIAAVARVRSPGCKFDTILTLEGPEGWNKSSAWAVLAGEGNFSDERIIGKDSREVQEALAGVWIHENADLAGLRKAEVETVKAFASRTSDRARPAYGRLSVEQPRHSIEVGTTNNSEYLQSQTGNRRFWPLKMERRADLARLRRERLQLWGEAATAQAAGESLVLDEHLWDAAAIEQEARRVKDPWEEVLAGLSGVSAAPEVGGVPYIGNGVVHVADGEWRVSSAVIFEHVLRVPAHLRNDLHAKRLANVMRALGWEGCVFKLEGKPARGYKKVP